MVVRSKATGAGKKVTAFAVHVSFDVYLLCKSCLSTGWELWRRFHRQMDYLVGLPGKNLECMRWIEAKCADGLAVRRATLRELKATNGTALLGDLLHRFWTEHSERARLTSWAELVPGMPGRVG